MIVVLVSHDLNLANRYCNRLMLLNSGKIYAAGKSQDVLTQDNIKEVYNIDVEINYNERTKSLNIVPLSPINMKV